MSNVFTTDAEQSQLSAMPVAVRRAIYVGFGVVTLAAGATDVGYRFGGGGIPHWLAVVEAVLLFLGPFVGGTAVTHTAKQEDTGSVSKKPESDTTDAGAADSTVADAGAADGPQQAQSTDAVGALTPAPATNTTPGASSADPATTLDTDTTATTVADVAATASPDDDGAISLDAVPDVDTVTATAGEPDATDAATEVVGA